MPSYVNIGARVGSGTMVDTWATVASCAQIGRNVHLSGGVGIGGVLEPPQAAPVVVEDDAMIGSRCMVTQGARVGKGAVLGEGVILNPGNPGHRRPDGRGSSGAAPSRRTRSVSRRAASVSSPAVSSPSRACWCSAATSPGERSHLNEILRESGVSVS
jgi:2,3,4,5-tetrahydropyridine-2-carboxylate N-succinyltransferase